MLEGHNWYRIAMPPKKGDAAFDAVVQPLVRRIHANTEHDHTVAVLRDTHLPKLMSGEIRVPEAEGAVAAGLPVEVAL